MNTYSVIIRAIRAPATTPASSTASRLFIWPRRLSASRSPPLLDPFCSPPAPPASCAPDSGMRRALPQLGICQAGSAATTAADDMWAAVMEAYPGGSMECHLSAMISARDAFDLLSDSPQAYDDRLGWHDGWRAELAVRMVAEAERQPPECAGDPP